MSIRSKLDFEDMRADFDDIEFPGIDRASFKAGYFAGLDKGKLRGFEQAIGFLENEHPTDLPKANRTNRFDWALYLKKKMKGIFNV
jgi:hypothetical protein